MRGRERCSDTERERESERAQVSAARLNVATSTTAGSLEDGIVAVKGFPLKNSFYLLS